MLTCLFKPCARDPLGNSKLFIKRETKNENWPSTRKLLGIKMRIHAHFQLCTERKWAVTTTMLKIMWISFMYTSVARFYEWNSFFSFPLSLLPHLLVLFYSNIFRTIRLVGMFTLREIDVFFCCWLSMVRTIGKNALNCNQL